MAQQHTLYAYALPTGSPIDVVGLFDAIQHFLADRVWTCPDIWLVSPNGSESPEVGVNMVLPNPGSEPPGWFADVEAIALFCAHRIEIMFGRLKDWRRVATRYDRCPTVFFSALALAATVLFCES